MIDFANIIIVDQEKTIIVTTKAIQSNLSKSKNSSY